MSWNRSREDTLAIPITALAMMILKDYADGKGWNWQSWMRTAEQQGTARDPAIGLALSEGWAWLMTHGLVVRDPSQTSADAYQVSRLGRVALKHGVDRLAASERLGMALHPLLSEQIQEQFLLGRRDLAVFAAMRQVEIRVRELANAPDSDIGVRLMTESFSPSKGPGALCDRDADPGEQVATMHLFAGAIGLFKNPSSHRAVDYDDPTVASEIVLLADLLLRLLDQVDARLNSQQPEE